MFQVGQKDSNPLSTSYAMTESRLLTSQVACTKQYESHGAPAGNTNAGHGRLSIEVVPPTPPPHGHQGNPNSTNGNNNGTTNHNNTMTATSTPTPIPDVSRDTPWPSGAHIQNGRFYQPISQNTGTITSLCWSTVPWHIRNHHHL